MLVLRRPLTMPLRASRKVQRVRMVVGITAGAFGRLPGTGLNATRPIASVYEILYSILTEEVGPVPLAGRREGR